MEKTFSKYKDTPNYITNLSRKNRIHPTMQEEKLWQAISGEKLKGLKFRRQFPIGRYIVDFYNHVHRLIIEIDGGIHNTTKEYDKNRDNYLLACGYKILRLTNLEIEQNFEEALQKISNYLISPPAGDLGGVTLKEPL
jgi:very-short-patch-repair endonuclease